MCPKRDISHHLDFINVIVYQFWWHKKKNRLTPNIYNAVYLTYYNSILLYLEKVFSTFKVTFPAVGGWIRITCLSSRTTLPHRSPWKHCRHGSTPSEVPRSLSGGLAQHNREISASLPLRERSTPHAASLAGRLSRVTMVPGRNHSGTGARRCSLCTPLNTLFCVNVLSQRQTITLCPLEVTKVWTYPGLWFMNDFSWWVCAWRG